MRELEFSVSKLHDLEVKFGSKSDLGVFQELKYWFRGNVF